MSKRGGKRPGAGAPKGNINALRTGAHCKRIEELLEKAPEGIWILDKRRNKLVFIKDKEHMYRLREGGMNI